MFNTIKKTLLILVIISATTQYIDFLAETTYYNILTECFNLHGSTLVKNNEQQQIDTDTQHLRDEMYVMLQGIYVSVLKFRGFQFSPNGEKTVQKFTEFLRKAYLWVPYHNICHGVMTMLHTQTLMADLPQGKRINDDKIRRSLLLGALLHDLSHPGYTNTSLGVYQTLDQNLIFLKQDQDTCIINDIQDVKFTVLKDLFGYNDDQVMKQEILEAFQFINDEMTKLVTPTDSYYQKNEIQKGQNQGNENLKYIMKNMCNQAEMGHAIIAYLYLKKSGFMDQVNMSYLIGSIFLTNMSVANYENVTFINSNDQIISLVHVADIANIGVGSQNLLIQTGQQVAFEFNMEGQKQNLGHLKQTEGGFGNGQQYFAANILKKHFQAEKDILNLDGFYGQLLQRINNRIERFGKKDAKWPQGKYATEKYQSFGQDNNTFLYKHFRI